MAHSNGQVPVAHNPVNPYGNAESAYPSHYHEGPPPGVASQQPLGFGYGHGHNTISMNPIQYPPQQTSHSMYPHPGGISQAASVPVHPPSLTDTKLKEEGYEESASKKKKDKRKKKKRHHSSSSSSSSSDDSTESRRRRKSVGIDKMYDLLERKMMMMY